MVPTAEKELDAAGYGDHFEILRKRYHRPLTWFVSGYLDRLSDPDRSRQIEDTVQEIMLKAYRMLDGYDHQRPTSTWIYSIARNHCIDLERRHRVRRAHLGYGPRLEVDAVPAAEPGPEQACVREELHAIVKAFVDALQPDDKALLLLRFYENQTYSSIARTVGRPTGTVKYRIHEIKRMLRDHLENVQ